MHVNSNIWLHEPPPLLHYSSASPDTNPFTLTVVAGNISVCRGCKQRYVKLTIPPMDLCIHHKEWQDFIDPDIDITTVHVAGVTNCTTDHLSRQRMSVFFSLNPQADAAPMPLPLTLKDIVALPPLHWTSP